MSDLLVSFNVLTGSVYTTALNYNPLYVNVVAVSQTSNGNQIVSVMFGGSPSGIYNVSVVSQTYGSFDSSAI